MFNNPQIPKEYLFKPICVDVSVAQEKVSSFIYNFRGWDLDLLKSVVMADDFEIIRKIPLNPSLSDRFIWHYDKYGKYTVESGCKLWGLGKLVEIENSN